jgi:hypothetical protein
MTVHQFSWGTFVSKINITAPTHTLLNLAAWDISWVPDWRYRHFDTFELIEAELQAVPNTLTEHNFQNAFKSGRNSGNSACSWKETTSRVMVSSRPKVFDQMAPPVPEILVGVVCVCFILFPQ